MFRLLFSLMLFGAVSANAQMSDPSKAAPNNVSATLSFASSSPVFGIAFEHMMKDSFGIGAALKMWQKNAVNTAAGACCNTTRSRNGALVVGATASHHFYKKDWDLSFTPSLNIIQIKPYATGLKDATTLAPGLATGIVMQMTPAIAVGFEYALYQAWFDSDYNGLLVQDLGVRGRFSF